MVTKIVNREGALHSAPSVVGWLVGWGCISTSPYLMLFAMLF